MLSESALERLTEKLVNRIEELNAYFVEKLGKQITTIGNVMPSQIRELMQTIQYGADIDEIMNKIAEITNLNVNDIYSIFEEVAKQNQEFAKQFYEYKRVKFVPYEQNKELQRQVRAIAKATAEEYINISNTMAYTVYNEFGEKTFTNLSKTYQEITDRAILNIS